jgi:hypothetical protein
MIGSYSIQDPPSPPPCRVSCEGVFLLEILRKLLPPMGFINLGVSLLIDHVISIHDLPLIDINSYNIPRLIRL